MKEKIKNCDTKFEKIAERIKNSELTQKIKEELLVLAKRGGQGVRETTSEFLDFIDNKSHIKEWLQSSAIIGVALEILPFSRMILLILPGFVPGALAGYMKGSKTDSCIQSTIIGGAISWPIKPVLMVSPIAGMLLVAFAAGFLEETLAKSANQVEAA